MSTSAILAERMSILRRMDELANRASKNVEGDRLVQDDVYCVRFRAFHVELSAETGEQNHWNVFVYLLDEARGLLAVHFRHRAVHHHEIEMAKPEFFERLAAACGSRDGMIVGPQVRHQHFATPRFVINDENVESGI